MPEIHSTDLCCLTCGINNPRKNLAHSPQQPLDRSSTLTTFQLPNSNKYPLTPILFFHPKAHNWVTLRLLRLGVFLTHYSKLKKLEAGAPKCGDCMGSLKVHKSFLSLEVK